MPEYRFPDESDPFGSAPYAERAEEITRKSVAEMAKANGQAALMCIALFIASLGFLVAAHHGLSNAEREYQSARRV